MTPEAVGPLLRMAQATTIHDAHECAVDAVKAGATGDEVRQAITEWMELQAAQVQTVVVPAPRRCRCSHGPSTHTGGYGQCWTAACGCRIYRDPNEAAAPRRLPEHLRTDDINDYLRQKGEL